MVRQTLEPSASAAVLHHHQNYDGTGFPKIGSHESGSPSGSAIHVFARVIHAANLYDRLATGAYDRRRSNIEILHLMRTKYAGRIDPIILRTLQAIAPPFPPGAKLSLTDGTDAVVVRVDQADPYFPVVRRLVGTEMKLDHKSLDLRDYDAPGIGRIGLTHVAPFMPKRSLSEPMCA
jgi:HD-GYP domain-containing protein (c-di-GMP phosphodiesterase class II)